MVPHLITALTGPINELEQRIIDSMPATERWFRLEWMEHTPPFYTSVDIRNAGFKLAPVDTNLFPGGWNNLTPEMLPLAVQSVATLVRANTLLGADEQAHEAIVRNLVLVQVMHSLFTVVLSTVERNRHDMFRLSAPVTLQALTAQHQALMQAILDGDPQHARECIGEHLEHVRTTIQRLDEDRARRERSTRLPLDVAPPSLLPPDPT